jgi:hypothetical protein
MVNSEFPLQKECDDIKNALDEFSQKKLSAKEVFNYVSRITSLVSVFLGKLQGGVNPNNLVRIEIERICNEFFQYSVIALIKTEKAGIFWGEEGISYTREQEIEVQKLLKDMDAGFAETSLTIAKAKQLLSFMNTRYESLKKIYDTSYGEK